MTLATQCVEQTGIIQWAEFALDSLDEFQSNLISWLAENCKEWFICWHLLDVHEDGAPKNPHLHFAFRLKSRKRLGTSLREISRAVGVDKNAVSIEKPTLYNSCVRYLIHLGWPEKHQYPREDIYTNLSREELAVILDSEDEKLDADTLRDIVKEANSYADIMKAIGLGLFRHYGSVIRMLYDEYHPIINSDGSVKRRYFKQKQAGNSA